MWMILTALTLPILIKGNVTVRVMGKSHYSTNTHNLAMNQNIRFLTQAIPLLFSILMGNTLQVSQELQRDKPDSGGLPLPPSTNLSIIQP